MKSKQTIGKIKASKLTLELYFLDKAFMCIGSNNMLKITRAIKTGINKSLTDVSQEIMLSAFAGIL